ncbi:MAG: hypothetical protein QOJ92_546 [Frankiales bacterium]|nr:hypothetical protein [Frankiales bacterium]
MSVFCERPASAGVSLGGATDGAGLGVPDWLAGGVKPGMGGVDAVPVEGAGEVEVAGEDVLALGRGLELVRDGRGAADVLVGEGAGAARFTTTLPLEPTPIPLAVAVKVPTAVSACALDVAFGARVSGPGDPGQLAL